LRLECPSQGLGLCKDVQIIHRVQWRVRSGLRNSVGDLCKGSSSTNAVMCDLIKGETTNKLLYFHFMPLRWLGMKAWLVGKRPHCSLQSDNTSTVEPGRLQAARCRTPTDIKPLWPIGEERNALAGIAPQ